MKILYALRFLCNSYQDLLSYDISNRKLETIFDAPEYAWIYMFDVSQDQQNIVMSYYAKSAETEYARYDRSGLFTISLTDLEAGKEIQPELLTGMDVEGQYLENPIWSADGKSVYYIERTAYYPDEGFPYEEAWLQMMDVETKESTRIALNGMWPRVSPDGSKIAYVEFILNESSKLIVANTDGSDPVILQEKTVDDGYLDAPVFTADSQTIIYSDTPPEEMAWFDSLLGTKAYAHANHSLPANWWSIPVTGGEPTQLTDTDELLIYPDTESDGDRFVYTTGAGVFLLDENLKLEPLLLGDEYRIVRWLK